MKNYNIKIIENSDIGIIRKDGRVYFEFSMDEVKYNKLMNSKTKSTSKKQPSTRELIIALTRKVDNIETKLDKHIFEGHK